MTFHRVMLAKCNGSECSNVTIVDNIMQDPEGWASDGTNHLCPDCVQRQQEQEAAPEEAAAPTDAIVERDLNPAAL